MLGFAGYEWAGPARDRVTETLGSQTPPNYYLVYFHVATFDRLMFAGGLLRCLELGSIPEIFGWRFFFVQIGTLTP